MDVQLYDNIKKYKHKLWKSLHNYKKNTYALKEARPKIKQLTIDDIKLIQNT
jgi:hypothetical protein